MIPHFIQILINNSGFDRSCLFYSMSFINHNGKIIPAATPIITADNRGLRFGDGLFETMKYKNETIILADEHLARLWQGLKLLDFEIPRLFTPDRLESEILSLIRKNNLKEARIRLTIYRSDGGLYDPNNLLPNYIIQTYSLPETNGRWNENGLHVCFYELMYKPNDAFSKLKHNNFLPYAMAALFAKKNKCNDAILFNPEKHVTDSTIANVFIIIGDAIYTPSVSDGCVEGVMRNVIIRQLRSIGYKLTETSITKEMLLQAEELFVTNSIYNLRWVSNLEEKKLGHKITRKIFLELSETIPELFC